MKPKILLILATVAALITAVWAGNIGVIAVSYGAYAGSGVSGGLQPVTADTAHTTSWQRKRHGTATWSSPLPVNNPVVKITTGSTFVDYDIHFIAGTSGDVPPADTSVRVFCNQLSIVTVSYP